MSTTSIDSWRSRYGGLKVNEAKRQRELEEQNRRLKPMVADLPLDNETLKSALGRES